MVRTLMICLAAGLLPGCIDSGRPPMGTVEGTVTFEGKPVSEGSIIFEVSGARPATGKIKDGKIVEVTTFEPNDGVAVGEAAVAVYATSGESVSAVTASPDVGQAKLAKGYMGSGQASLIPDRYNNPSTSQLSCEIQPGKNHVEFELTKN
ncbi:hypothetical protein Pan97_19420 [Bremerella volcania]|uniref:Carboxypeptidase regulatory-like domain-containing protein n=1 Tax=Bremerella volcania TaxID=2527984 RepID=A0A518C6U6_9BACT|nr:hypothetical protein [Bremerella volcania]QDU74922.1 hypothetical protein Pan97_19420 [Bremerella volcania]